MVKLWNYYHAQIPDDTMIVLNTEIKNKSKENNKCCTTMKCEYSLAVSVLQSRDLGKTFFPVFCVLKIAKFFEVRDFTENCKPKGSQRYSFNFKSKLRI